MRLTDRYEVHVLTSRAIDYITWKDEYAAGEEMLNGVHVHRFSVAHPRVPADFDAINGDSSGFLEPVRRKSGSRSRDRIFRS